MGDEGWHRPARPRCPLSSADRQVMRVGIAGLGVAATIALPEIASHPRVHITAGADERADARQAFGSQFQAETYASVEQMCASNAVDVVYVLTPNRLHAQHAVLAAEHRKQVILDKPIGTSLEEADRAIAAAMRNGVRLLVGHTQSLDAPIRRMAEIARDGSLGPLLMVNTWFFSDWLYRPRSREELDSQLGEGLVYRQGPVQVDIVRMIGGGMVRSVRATTSASDPNRPVDGSYAAFAEFADGAAATLVYSGLAFFDSAELTYGIGLQGYPADAATHQRTRALVRGFADAGAEADYKDSTRYGGSRYSARRPSVDPTGRRHAFFGLTLVTCEKGDIRQTPSGLVIYGEHGPQHMPLDAGSSFSRRYTSAELDLMYAAWSKDAPLASHDGVWAKGTLEMCLAILESARERREVRLSFQTPSPARSVQ